jgi:two-component system response regulator DevR
VFLKPVQALSRESLEESFFMTTLFAPEKKMSIRLYTIDSYQAYQEGFRTIIQGIDDIEIIGVAEKAANIFKSDEISRADVVIVDADLSDKSGLEICLYLANHYPTLKTILLCENDWDIYLFSAYKAHCAGVLVRRLPTVTMINSIRQVHNETHFTHDQMKRIEQWQRTIGEELKSLKPREWKVLWQLSAGLSNRAIADWLGISKGTVEKYVSNLLTKFDLKSRSALLSYIHNHHFEVYSSLSNEARLKILST